MYFDRNFISKCVACWEIFTALLALIRLLYTHSYIPHGYWCTYVYVDTRLYVFLYENERYAKYIQQKRAAKPNQT